MKKIILAVLLTILAVSAFADSSNLYKNKNLTEFLSVSYTIFFNNYLYPFIFLYHIYINFIPYKILLIIFWGSKPAVPRKVFGKQGNNTIYFPRTFPLLRKCREIYGHLIKTVIIKEYCI